MNWTDIAKTYDELFPKSQTKQVIVETVTGDKIVEEVKSEVKETVVEEIPHEEVETEEKENNDNGDN